MRLAVGGRSTEKLTAAIDNASIGHCGVTEDGTFDISRSKKVVVHQTVFLLSLA